MSESTESTEKKRKGGATKKAPPGCYTAREAQNALGINADAFRYYVRKGRIKRYVPPMKKEGYYKKEEIDDLATQLALFMHTVEPKSSTVTRVARVEDTPGIVEVLTIRGWKTASAEQRASWYAVNPYVDYVVATKEGVMGYIHAVPYTPDTLEGLLSGAKRSWHVQPTDILPYEPGEYDLYIGIATRTDMPDHTQRFGFRLISGFLTFLEDLARQHVFVRRLYAASDQKDGMDLCRDLGFDLLPRKEGDLFYRYCLDMKTSPSLFAQKYRASIQR